MCSSSLSTLARTKPAYTGWSAPDQQGHKHTWQCVPITTCLFVYAILVWRTTTSFKRNVGQITCDIRQSVESADADIAGTLVLPVAAVVRRRCRLTNSQRSRSAHYGLVSFGIAQTARDITVGGAKAEHICSSGRSTRLEHAMAPGTTKLSNC